MGNRELQQGIRSLKSGDTADERRILITLTGVAGTAAPAAGDKGYSTDNEGIIHLEARDDAAPGSPWTGGTFRGWWREDELSGDWKAGTVFTWDYTVSQTITLNNQGKTQFFLQVVTKDDNNSAASFWGGVNTVEGA